MDEGKGSSCPPDKARVQVGRCSKLAVTGHRNRELSNGDGYGVAAAEHDAAHHAMLLDPMLPYTWAWLSLRSHLEILLVAFVVSLGGL